MSEKSDIELIREIFDATVRIEVYIHGYTYEVFINDGKTIDAILMNLIVIGESANRLSEDFKEKYDGVDWFNIRGLRNRVAHDYKGTNLKIVWDVSTINIKELKNYLEKLLQ
jgi:uncharacterized protein with HEPN domain